MEKFTIKDVTPNMGSATDFNIHWWAFLRMLDSVETHEKALKSCLAGNDAESVAECIKEAICYRIIESKKIVVEIYNKLTTFEEFKTGLIEKPDWMDEFLNTENP